MKLTSRLFRTSALSLTITLGMAVCLPAFSEAAGTGSSPKTNDTTSAFCTNLPTLASNASGRMTTLQNNLAAAEAKHLSTLQTNWTNWANSLSALQSKWAQDRTTEYAQLMDLATTSSEQAAVTTFENTVNTAITTRESANASARTTYQNGVLADVNGESATVKQLVDTLVSTDTGTIQTAENTCQSNPSGGVGARTVLDVALKSARTQYAGEVSTDQTNNRAAIQALQSTLKNTVNTNDEAFTATLKTATTTLKAAF
jgi:hypothetical protein